MKIGNLTQFFQPLKRPMKNKVNFYWYELRQSRNVVNLLNILVLIASVISAVLDSFSFFTDKTLYKVLYVIGILFPLALKLYDYVKHYDERFTSISPIADAYEDVAPPDSEWIRKDLKLDDKTKEPVFVCSKIDNWLAGEEPIGLHRDKKHEHDLGKKIRKQWKEIYQPFLYHNHRDAMFNGKQFDNEEKFGISSELEAGADTVCVHKTCYFDSYLTNIIPGKELTSNRDIMGVVTTYPELMPYIIDNNKKKKLMPLGERFTANEPGVTTLCLLKNGHIRLWRQNRMAMCSTGRMVASGSGSADWADCKKYFNDTNGFRKAVIKGMQRELWEESYGTRELSIEKFMKKVDTRIIGYFRWLKKAGKSEFVGISRLTDESLVRQLSPEKSEVTDGIWLLAGTMQELLNSIEKEVTETKDGTIKMPRCSVSCGMAMLALKRICVQYCAEKCSKYDCKNNCCSVKDCDKKPYDVLFEGVEIVHPD